ncbi:MAG TPA: hypothetical protein VFB31_11570 [Pseudolabrys sp.]|nr:hypothetical protein [Pseudolabrys sp.]
MTENLSAAVARQLAARRTAASAPAPSAEIERRAVAAVAANLTAIADAHAAARRRAELEKLAAEAYAAAVAAGTIAAPTTAAGDGREDHAVAALMPATARAGAIAPALTPLPAAPPGAAHHMPLRGSAWRRRRGLSAAVAAGALRA